MLAVIYEVSAQKDLTLVDLIHGSYPYDATSRLSRVALEKQLAKDSGQQESDVREWVEPGTTPDSTNFTFTFTDDTVKLYFQEYQVGPYAIGPQSVELKRADLDAAAQRQS